MKDIKMKDIYITGGGPILSVVSAAIAASKLGKELIVVEKENDPFSSPTVKYSAMPDLPDIMPFHVHKKRRFNNRKGHKRKKARNGRNKK